MPLLGDSGVETLRQADGAYAFRLETPAPELEETPDGFRVKIEGFGTQQRRPEAPDLPLHTVLVAVPPGSSPRITFDASPARLLRRGSPRPVGVRELDPRHPAMLRLDPDGDVDRRLDALGEAKRMRYRRDPEIYSGKRRFPERIVRLGDRGTMRSQEYVEVVLAPVIYDPEANAVLVHDRIDVTVHFGSGTVADTAPAPEDSAFEPVYRRAIANYDQGRGFRVGVTRAPQTAEAQLGDPAARFEIDIDADGIYRLDHAAVQGTPLIAEPISTWVLTNRGVQVPFEVQDGDNDDFMDPGDVVQFFGEALTDEPHTELDYDRPFFDDDLWADRDYTDTNVYVLTTGAAGQPEMAKRNSAPGMGAAPLFFTATAHAEEDSAFRGSGPDDPWYWTPTSTTNTAFGGSPTRTETVPLPGLYTDGGADPLQVRVRVLGRNEDPDFSPDHPTQVTLADAGSQVLAVDPASFDGRIHFTHDFGWSGTGLTEPVEITFEVLPSGGALHNEVILDYIEIDYRRAFLAEGNRLEFTWPDGNQVFEIGGLGDSTPQIYETTPGPSGEPTLPVRLTGLVVSGGNPYTVRFEMQEDPAIPDGTPRRFLVLGDSAIQTLAPAELRADTVSDLRDNALQADVIVITHPDLHDEGPDDCGLPNPTGCLTAWRNYRASAAGGGYTTKVVLTDDIDDEFNHGLPGPTAIREFLRWVLSSEPGEGWAAPKPTHVLLLGDAHFDSKGGTAVGNYVPTQILYLDEPELGYYASDNVMAAVAGDDKLPDLFVSRLPGRSVAEINHVLHKTLDFAQNAPQGLWRRHALFMSDRGKEGNNPSEALKFEAINAIGRNAMDIPPYTSLELRYWSDFCDPNPVPLNCDREGMRAAIKDAVNGMDAFDGTAVAQFSGHSNFVVWSDDAFFDVRPTIDDVDDLGNAPELPWLVAHNCLSGGFHAGTTTTMGEAWLQWQDGGAIGVFAPSGLSNEFTGENVTGVLWPVMFGSQQERNVGTLVMGALSFLCTSGAVESCENYVSLGDPLIDIALQSVEPAEDVTATSGNALVQLSWTASPTAGVTYDVYRIQPSGAPPASTTYVKINGSPLTGTSFDDTTVENAEVYRYYVLAIDAEGFRSRWSNFNTDCDVSGPDCVEGIPLNPDPPQAPTGVEMDDPGTGNALRVSWDPNPELDLDYYTIHYGTTSGSYTGTVDFVRGSPDGWIFELTEGEIVYAAVTATNTSGNTSAFSAEVSNFPVFGPGLRPPAFIEDLTVKIQGSDLVLEWSPVTLTAYGQPADVASYEILRGDGTAYDNANLVPIGTCPSPCTDFVDVGAAAAPSSFFYRVRALDTAGNAGGLGSDAPNGTELSVVRSVTPGDLVLQWLPVTSTPAGAPAAIVEYRVFVADAPFTREEVRDGMVGPPTVVQGTSLELTPPMQNRYYSVLAVDIRGNLSLH